MIHTYRYYITLFFDPLISTKVKYSEATNRLALFLTLVCLLWWFEAYLDQDHEEVDRPQGKDSSPEPSNTHQDSLGENMSTLFLTITSLLYKKLSSLGRPPSPAARAGRRRKCRVSTAGTGKIEYNIPV